MAIGADLVAPSKMTHRANISEILTEAIISNKIKPGERLNESEIARQLGISRAPIREALQSLQEQGLVINNPRRGMFVVELGEVDKQKINSVRIVLEAEALRLCRRYLDVAGEGRLQTIVEEMLLRAGGPTDTLWRLDLDFHRMLWNLSRNEVLEKTLMNLTAPLFTHASAATQDKAQRKTVIASHADLLEYVKGKSNRTAEDALLEHYRIAWPDPDRYSSCRSERS